MATTAQALLALLVVALALHVAALAIALAQAALPSRRDDAYHASMAAGAISLLGELMILGGLVGRERWVYAAPLALLAGLGMSLLVSGPARQTPAGRAAWHARIAAPLGLAVVLVVALM